MTPDDKRERVAKIQGLAVLASVFIGLAMMTIIAYKGESTIVQRPLDRDGPWPKGRFTKTNVESDFPSNSSYSLYILDH